MKYLFEAQKDSLIEKTTEYIVQMKLSKHYVRIAREGNNA